MAIKLNEVIPLGRTLQEYIKMFGLTEADLDKKILDCGGGPSSFNHEMTARNKNVTSIDPIYGFRKEDIKKRIDETFGDIIEQARANQERFVWKNIKNVAELAGIRMTAMEAFLADFERGKREKRYLDEELPNLNFSDNEFEIALSSHFLFLYTNILSLDFHLKSIREMLRVAREIRIFPLLDLSAEKSRYVEQISEILEKEVSRIAIETVDYEFQKGGNQMMRILKND